METIELREMTRELCHELFRNWENDDSIFMDQSSFEPYVYDKEKVDSFFDQKQQPDRIMFAIMLEDKPIGALDLKRIDPDKKECTLSIHMQNDAFKNKGYGTEAERLAVDYAFNVLGMERVKADSLLKNTRSQHVLMKVGFKQYGEDDKFRYYCIDHIKPQENGCR